MKTLQEAFELLCRVRGQRDTLSEHNYRSAIEEIQKDAFEAGRADCKPIIDACVEALNSVGDPGQWMRMNFDKYRKAMRLIESPPRDSLKAHD